MSSSNTYAPLPFSYLTGGGAADRRPTGMKKAKSEEDGLDRTGRDPYSIYTGTNPSGEEHRNIRRKQSIDIADPTLDVTDPYLLSTGAFHRPGGSLQDVRDSYSEDPRYKDTVPSGTDGGNVFFRSSDGSESSGKSPRSGDNLVRQPDQQPITTLTRPGYTNPNLDTMTRDEDTSGKKLPRFKMADDGGYQYYTGGNGNAKPLPNPQNNAQPKPGMDNASNPIWDKYYATGGLAPGYEGYSPNVPSNSGSNNSPNSPMTNGPGPGVRPTTKTDDFNTLLRTSGASDSLRGNGCCSSKKGAVLCAVFITAFICLGIGFVAGWFVFQAVYPDSTTTTGKLCTRINLESTTTIGKVYTRNQPRIYHHNT